MANEDTKKQIPLIYYVISLTSAVVVGIDVGLVSYLYTYLSIGIAGGLFIALAGFLLNAYVYFELGPDSIDDLISSKLNGFLPRLVDALSLLGAVFIGLFTIFAYQQMIVEYAFLGVWFNPFFIFSMTIAYVIATFALNKSGLLNLLNMINKEGLNSVSEVMNKFWNNLKKRCDWDNKSVNIFSKLYAMTTNIILPLCIGLIVTIAYTSTFLYGALHLVTPLTQAWLLVPIVWMTGIAFFIGELYFNCEQNLELIASTQSTTLNLSLVSSVVLLVVIANAVANAFIAMDGPFLMMTLWGGLKFFSGGFQSFFTMSNRCLVKFESWSNLSGGEPYKVLAFSILALSVLSLVYMTCLVGVVKVLPFLGASTLYGVILYIMFFNSSTEESSQSKISGFSPNSSSAIPPNSTSVNLVSLKKGEEESDRSLPPPLLLANDDPDDRSCSYR